MYELAHGTEEVAELKQALDIDAGQLSRHAHAGSRSRASASREPSPLDARRQQVRLTEAGQSAVRRDGPRLSGRDRRGAGRPRRRCRGRRRDGAAQARDRARGHAHAARRSSPATSAGWWSATACCTPASTAGTRASSASSPGSPPTSTRPRTAAGSPRSTASAWAPSCASAWTTTTAKLRTLLVEPQARGHGVGTSAGRPGHRARHAASGYTHADAVDQRASCTPRAGSTSARGFTLEQRGAAPRVRQGRPRRADLVPYPPAMDRDAAEGAPGAAEEPLQGRPGPRPLITLKANGTLGDGVSCNGRDRPRDRPGRPAPATGGDGSAAVLRRHAARGARRLRRRHARRGGHSARGPDQRRPRPRRGRPRLPRHARRRQGGAGRLPRHPPAASSSTPTADDEQLATLLKLTERYCVVLPDARARPAAGRHARARTRRGLERPRARTRAGPRRQLRTASSGRTASSRRSNGG